MKTLKQRVSWFVGAVASVLTVCHTALAQPSTPSSNEHSSSPPPAGVAAQQAPPATSTTAAIATSGAASTATTPAPNTTTTPEPVATSTTTATTSSNSVPTPTLPPAPAATAPAPAPNPNALVLAGGFGRGFTIQTQDERYSLTIRARAQARFTVVVPNRPTGMEPLASTEFVVRRLRLLLTGNLLSKQFQYYIQLGMSPQDMEPDLLVPVRDAYMTYQLFRDLNIKFGQMKVPFNRQRVISSSALQYADRSIANGELNLDRDIGEQLYSNNLFGLGHRLGYQLGLFGGNGRNRIGLDPGMLYVARIQFQPLGEFEDMDHEGDLVGGKPRLSIGAGIAFNHQTKRALSTHGATFQHARFDYLHAEADLLFKWAGFSLQGEWIYRHADRDSNVYTPTTGTPITEYSRSAMGYMVQAAYQFPVHVEVGARWGQIIPFAGTDPALVAQNELGGVLNWYPLRHSLKLQTDYFYLFGNTLEAGRHQIRVQLQAYF